MVPGVREGLGGTFLDVGGREKGDQGPPRRDLGGGGVLGVDGGWSERGPTRPRTSLSECSHPACVEKGRGVNHCSATVEF